jgi:hypothetical protein
MEKAKYIIFQIFVLFSILIIITPTQAAEENVIYNPGMEDGNSFNPNIPDGWRTQFNDLDQQTGWATDEAHSGSRSLKIVNSTYATARWYGEAYFFAEPYPDTLTLGGWAKAENVEDRGIFAMDFYIEFEDGSSGFFFEDFRFSPGTHDWENVEQTITFDQGVTLIQPYCILYSTTGTAWFDDVYAIIKEDEDNDVLNPSMEDGETYPDYWWTYGNDLSRESGWAEGIAHSGSRSIQIVNTTDARAGWEGETVFFSEPYPDTLTLGGWAKAENVAAGGAFVLDFYIEFEDGSSVWYYHNLRFSPGTHDWENVESTVFFGKDVKLIRPYCLLYSTTGTAWFDDIYAMMQ